MSSGCHVRKETRSDPPSPRGGPHKHVDDLEPANTVMQIIGRAPSGKAIQNASRVRHCKVEVSAQPICDEAIRRAGPGRLIRLQHVRLKQTRHPLHVSPLSPPVVRMHTCQESVTPGEDEAANLSLSTRQPARSRRKRTTYRAGRRSASEAIRPSPRMTAAAEFRGSSCQSNSLHLPQGGRMRPSSVTATTIETVNSPPLSIAATAACSAQKPRLHRVSMQIPV